MIARRDKLDPEVHCVPLVVYCNALSLCSSNRRSEFSNASLSITRIAHEGICGSSPVHAFMSLLDIDLYFERFSKQNGDVN